MLAFDIETGPLANGEEIKPFDQGRLKDPAKVEAAKAEYFGKLALHWTTGEILCIGYCNEHGSIVDHQRITSEAEMLKRFWNAANDAANLEKKNVWGFNSHRFDLPFIVGRSRVHRIKVPDWAMDGRYWHRHFKDAAKELVCHQPGEFISLDVAAKALGLPGKLDDIGENFYLTYRDNPELALQYTKRDAVMTYSVALVCESLVEA